MEFDKNKILNLGDDELLRALILRNEYTNQAKNIIIEEAIKREIIESESDLNQEKFAAITLKKQSVLQFSTITSIYDAQKICDSISHYFYFIGIGFGGVAAINKIFICTLNMWVNIYSMIIAFVLALLFHRFKSMETGLALGIFAIASVSINIFTLITNFDLIVILGILLNFILLYFSSEAYFACKYIKEHK